MPPYEAIIAFVLLLAGVVVTIHPPVTKRHRAIWLGAFVILGLANVWVSWANAIEDRQTEKAITEGIGEVVEQTKQPPNVIVNVPAPVVQLLPAPSIGGGQPTPRNEPPRRPTAPLNSSPPGLSLPTNIRVLKTQKPIPDLFNALASLQQQGIGLLNAGLRTGAELYEGMLQDWGMRVLNVLSEHERFADSYLMNSDVGLPNHSYPTELPASNRITYHNVWFRVYRLDQLLPKIEAEMKRDPSLIFGKPQ